MIRRAMNLVAGDLSSPVVSAWPIVATLVLWSACLVWPEIDTAVTTHLSFLAIVLTPILLVAGDRDTRALQAKLDETIRAIPQADDRLIGLEKQD